MTLQVVELTIYRSVVKISMSLFSKDINWEITSRRSLNRGNGIIIEVHGIDNFVNQTFLSEMDGSIRATIYMNAKITSDTVFFTKKELFFLHFHLQLVPCLLVLEEIQIVIDVVEANDIVGDE